jgi:hypothetical protein
MKTSIRVTMLAVFLIVGLIGSAIAYTGETRGMASAVAASGGGVIPDGFTWG